MFVRFPRLARLFVVACALLLMTRQVDAYSLLTHEQIIDLAWRDSIVPALLAEYPGLTPKQIDEAHAYAYGGCAIQDLGYYPFGNGFFSDLTHYVRSGDFIRSLFRNEHNVNELAFAIGALSHYLGDNVGHAAAVNPSVAVEFPSLAQRFGPTVNYAQGPHQHIQTEFAFDVNQISKRHLAPLDYLNHIGLKIPQQLLAKAFFDTYGVTSTSVIGGRRPTIRVYRFGVRSFIPRIAYAEAYLHRGKFMDDTPSPGLDRYLEQQSAAEKSENWATYRKHHIGFKTRFVAALIVILPKVGFLRELAIRGPNAATEQLYIDSVNRSAGALRNALRHMDTLQARIPNRDLDTGVTIHPGGYPLTDITYAKLLKTITKDPNAVIPTGLSRAVKEYYADPDAPILTKKKPKQWAAVQAELTILDNMKTRRDPPVPDIDPNDPDDSEDVDGASLSMPSVTLPPSSLTATAAAPAP